MTEQAESTKRLPKTATMVYRPDHLSGYRPNQVYRPTDPGRPAWSFRPQGAK